MIIGIIMVVVGYLMVKKPTVAYELIGRLNFAEKFFTSGSTFMFQVIGVLLILGGFAVVTGVHDNILAAIANFIVPG
ncbi:hypothetical protein HN958_01925 [Candidatus Falkowbacteria bacterium]|nr:hypothetical protein [Candidatus Falkowbacteria bacterium]